MNHKVLLVDDEAGVRTVIGLALADAGYEVIPAEGGIQALDAFAEHAPSVVLTDIKMPGVDGMALLKEIKETSPDTEVIMVTGHGDMSLAIESLRHGAADFINKPVSNEALLVALERARERIRMREALREHTEHLERLVEEKTRELIHAERMGAVGEAVADLSHAIKNIASGLEGGMFVLDKGIQLNKRKYLFQGWELISGGVERIKNLSLDLLNYAKFARIEPVPSDPLEPARQAVALMADRARGLGVTLALEEGGAPERLDLDADAVLRALLNLIGNGLDACAGMDRDQGRGGRVTVRVLGSERGGVRYEVEDDGPGLSPEAEGKVLASFFTTKGSQGTGVGLMICKRIAEEHGGGVSHQPAASGGALFRLDIPSKR